MNPLIIIGIGAGLLTWGIKTISNKPEKDLTPPKKADTVADTAAANNVPIDEKPISENSDSVDSGDGDI